MTPTEALNIKKTALKRLQYHCRVRVGILKLGKRVPDDLAEKIKDAHRAYNEACVTLEGLINVTTFSRE